MHGHICDFGKGIRTTVDKKRNFITSKSDASEEQEIIPTGVGEIPAEDSSVSMADILGDCDDEDDAEELELDDILEHLGKEDD